MKRRITDIQVQKKHPSRRSIFLDEKFFCGVSEEVAVKFDLKRGVEIDEVRSVTIPHGLDTRDPQHLGRHIRRVLEEEEIGTKHAIVDIPRDQATLNTLMLPAASPEELPGMVEIQIAKELPFAVSDAAVDFVAGEPKGDTNTIAVQVAAVRREALEQYEATFAAAGLRLERVGLRPYANRVAVCELLKHAMPDRVMFIDVRPTLTEIDVLKHSSLAFSRAASVLIPPDLGEDTHLSLVRDDFRPGNGRRTSAGHSGTPLGSPRPEERPSARRACRRGSARYRRRSMPRDDRGPKSARAR